MFSVIANAGYRRNKKNQKNGILWKVRCECGAERNKVTFDLISGRAKSCGCSSASFIAKSKIKPGAALNWVFRSYKQNSKRRNIIFDLDKNFFSELTRKICFYCGRTPYLSHKARSGEIYYYNGIDRVDNSLGYIPSNVVSCCSVCNRAKDRMGLEEFLVWIKAVAVNRGLFSNG